MEQVDIAIIGAGFSGLGTAIRLRAEGFDDFVVLERHADVGGTWWANTYPGCACDVPSHLYSFSFAPNPDWTRTYSPQPEIRDYLRRCAERYDLYRSIRLGTSVDGRRLGRGRRALDARDVRRAAERARADRRHGPADRAEHARRCPASTASPARSSTPPAGTTTTTSPASAWR